MRKFMFFLSFMGALAACGSGRKASAPEPAPAPVSGETASFAAAPRFDDLDPVEWPGTKPTNYRIHGIDVSRWQGDIDWYTARNAGVSFVFIKATEGGDVADPKFDDHRTGAKRAGVRYGAYHYFYFCRPATEQAEWFIKHVPRENGSLPHVLDLEWNHKSKTCPYRPEGYAVRHEARVFLDMLEAHYGKRPMIYTTPDFYQDTRLDQMRGETFWLRSVADHPRTVYPGARWTFWQYTGTGVVPGVEGKVDINVFAGAPESWAGWRR
ncbi:glycoside hydrolase family 25 protein [Phaeobacter marinintestinus]|uniref:glycoside hydrolase family 25 protein n=1 Tax=Falsiphaeobacter marinintestinus TaxID=1492905 RepID=UPI0011B54B64|nr:GH25 family lysozyme [Phaeobacter marinintestinus]